MENRIEKARAKAANDIAKAEHEQRIIDNLPTISNEVSVISFAPNKMPWVKYKPTAFSDVLAIADQFDVVPTFDYRHKGSRSFGPSMPDGADQEHEESAFLIRSNARCPEYMSGAASADFIFHAKLESGDVVRVIIAFDRASCFATPWAKELEPRFDKFKGTGWECRAPAIFPWGSHSVSYATGAPRGQAFNGHTFMERETLEQALAYITQ